jgi:pyruvate kinase
MRHTKIVATVGPASSSEAVLDELIAAGVDVFRLNFSHGTPESHRDVFTRIRASAERTNRVVGIMQDLSGPKIRTGALKGGRPLELRRGDPLVIATGDFAGSANRVSTTYGDLARSVRPGDRLLLDDGRIELHVEDATASEIVTRVVDGGLLGERKGINAPNATLPTTALTAKDLEDIRFGVELGVDLIAVSFVQSGADMLRTREAIGSAGGHDIPLIAKIERPQAVEQIDGILAASDAVMVARGDLGLEMPLERVPRVQKDITRRARGLGLPVIVATQVLESMLREPRPTRAEVSDAANAVDDGVDAIMLAGESAVGMFPVRAVQTLDMVIRDAEAMTPQLAPARRLSDLPDGDHGRALCGAAINLAHHGHADAIVAVTQKGSTARLLAALRPEAPIHAATEHPETARRLTMVRGVAPHVIPAGGDLDTTDLIIEEYLLQHGVLPAGAVVVSVSIDRDLSRRDANFLKLRRMGTGG